MIKTSFFEIQARTKTFLVLRQGTICTALVPTFERPLLARIEILKPTSSIKNIFQSSILDNISGKVLT